MGKKHIAEHLKMHFYDIESLDNVFSLCNFKSEKEKCDLYILTDGDEISFDKIDKARLEKAVYKANDNFRGPIKIYDLHTPEACVKFAEEFGLSDAYNMTDRRQKSSYPDSFRLTCETDKDYDEAIHPYLLGYNSYNYDTTMVTLFNYEVWNVTAQKTQSGELTNKSCTFTPITARTMRDYNDELFLPEFKKSMPQRLTQNYDIRNRFWTPQNYRDPRWKIRKNMLASGRHLDVAMLNEKQQKVALKRIIGMLGGQILESDRLDDEHNHIENLEELYKLLAYNVSDCVNLDKIVFRNRPYYTNFNLKRRLLKRYPDLIYLKCRDSYKPDISPETVDLNRLRIDSSSAQIATRALCPYGHIKDIPVVSFLYPHEEQAKKLGIKQINVLEEMRKFFYMNFRQPELRKRFDKIYNYYKSIEGKNFNASKNYADDYAGSPLYKTPMDINRIPQPEGTGLILPYFDADGNETSCFVNFSTGGIHGAEYNKAKYDHDVAAYLEQLSIIDEAKSLYPDPIEMRKAKEFTLKDGRTVKYTQVLKSSATMKKAEYKIPKKPELFTVSDTGKISLHKKYTFTSAGKMNHEDFESYYPNLLMRMMTFMNEGLGYDRYEEIFRDKQDFGNLMKDKSLTQEERDDYSLQRNGTKLLLNSASGAGDATFDSNIRVNNSIISMRIIGQLFSWRIGQAQAAKGAKVPSTNTDGLYTQLEENYNNQILAQESANIGVNITPEITFLISKDTNNRIEMDPVNGEVVGANGGTTGCYWGPNPEKSLAHPSVIDWALSEYLIVCALKQNGNSLSKPFNEKTGMAILKTALTREDRRHVLNKFQNVIASSTGTSQYNFSVKPDEPGTPINMQHYNRVFIMKDKTEGTVHLYKASAKKVTPAMKTKRKRLNERMQQHDPIAVQILTANGVHIHSLPCDEEATVGSISNIDTGWYMYVENHSLWTMPDEQIDWIYDNLDLDKYLQLLCSTFTKNWMNELPEPAAYDIKPKLKSQLENSLEHAAKLKTASDMNTYPDGYADTVTDSLKNVIDLL